MATYLNYWQKGVRVQTAETQAERIERYARQIKERKRLKWLERHPLYSTWYNMISRCYNPNVASYKYYGGRGITVCDQWRKDFQRFLNDMGARPEGMTLERVNVELGYTPDNCRWATLTEQARNKRNTDRSTYKFMGLRLTIHQWSELLEVPQSTLRARYHSRGTFIRRRPCRWETDANKLLSKY